MSAIAIQSIAAAGLGPTYQAATASDAVQGADGQERLFIHALNTNAATATITINPVSPTSAKVPGVGQVAAIAVDADGLQFRVVPPSEHADVVAALAQLARDRRAQEAAAAGDERAHQASSCSAQTASFSRKILALWRMSTGKDGWTRNFFIF